MNILHGIEFYNGKIETIPITKELLIMAHSAHLSYAIYLEKDKMVKEDEEKKRKTEEDERNSLQEKRIRIDTLEKELKKKEKEGIKSWYKKQEFYRNRIGKLYARNLCAQEA